MRRALASGLAVGLLYLATASLTFKAGVLPVRPFFDGNHAGQTEPYMWVDPPPGEMTTGEPKAVTKVVMLNEKGIEGDAVLTDDGLAALYIPDGTILPAEGQTGVKITIEPVDADGVGDPPEGRSYNGNAYRIGITYEPSGAPARYLSGGGACADLTTSDVQNCLSLELRYAYVMPGIEMYRRAGPDWTPVVGLDAPVAAKFSAEVPEPFGIFVLTGVGDLPGVTASRTSDYIAIGLGVLAVVLGVSVARSRNDRKRKEMIARARGKKGKRSAVKPKARGAR